MSVEEKGACDCEGRGIEGGWVCGKTGCHRTSDANDSIKRLFDILSGDAAPPSDFKRRLNEAMR